MILLFSTDSSYRCSATENCRDVDEFVDLSQMTIVAAHSVYAFLILGSWQEVLDDIDPLVTPK
jgi:hypothetical protein